MNRIILSSGRTPGPLRASRGGRICCMPKAEFERWDKLPYGYWTCADGRQVTFSRFYEPLFEAYPGGPIRPADPNELVRWKRQHWFYDHNTRNKRQAATRALAEWRVQIEGLNPGRKPLRAGGEA